MPQCVQNPSVRPGRPSRDCADELPAVPAEPLVLRHLRVGQDRRRRVAGRDRRHLNQPGAERRREDCRPEPSRGCPRRLPCRLPARPYADLTAAARRGGPPRPARRRRPRRAPRRRRRRPPGDGGAGRSAGARPQTAQYPSSIVPPHPGWVHATAVTAAALSVRREDRLLIAGYRRRGHRQVARRRPQQLVRLVIACGQVAVLGRPQPGGLGLVRAQETAQFVPAAEDRRRASLRIFCRGSGRGQIAVRSCPTRPQPGPPARGRELARLAIGGSAISGGNGGMSAIRAAAWRHAVMASSRAARRRRGRGPEPSIWRCACDRSRSSSAIRVARPATCFPARLRRRCRPGRHASARADQRSPRRVARPGWPRLAERGCGLVAEAGDQRSERASSGSGRVEPRAHGSVQTVSTAEVTSVTSEKDRRIAATAASRVTEATGAHQVTAGQPAVPAGPGGPAGTSGSAPGAGEQFGQLGKFLLGDPATAGAELGDPVDDGRGCSAR